MASDSPGNPPCPNNFTAVTSHPQRFHEQGVAAVVLRVDSPGGDALASDLMWAAIKRLRRFKPVVASFGDVSASGDPSACSQFSRTSRHAVWQPARGMGLDDRFPGCQLGRQRDGHEVDTAGILVCNQSPTNLCTPVIDNCSV